MPRDSQQAAQRATAYMSDSRVKHFWDLWRFGTRTFAQQLNIPIADAWDMFTFYKPHVRWRDAFPEPTFWMQNRDLKIGTPYSQQAMEQQLRPWLQ